MGLVHSISHRVTILRFSEWVCSAESRISPDCVFSIPLVDRNPFWEVVKGKLFPLPTALLLFELLIVLIGAVTAPPNAEQKACHYPKPILLNTVRLSFFLRSLTVT